MPEATHNRPIRGRFHAWFLQATEDFVEEVHGDRKRELFAGLTGTVVELGPGTGANCRHYPPGVRVIGIEPNLRMHEPLRTASQRHAVDLEIRGLRGEGLDLPDACADAVVCTLVLCSVADPAAVVREALRVLRPGGRFISIEHVGAPRGSGLRRLQNVVRRPWSFWFEGCQTNRDTQAVLEAAGFSSLKLERFRIPGPFVHVSPQIAGVAVK